MTKLEIQNKISELENRQKLIAINEEPLVNANCVQIDNLKAQLLELA